VHRVPARSKRVFSALASVALSSSIRRRLAVSAVSALAFGIVSTLPAPAPSSVNLVTIPTAGGGWLTRLNEWRTNTGLSALGENTTWSAGDYDHALYMVKNDLVTHYETPGVPYYTTAGDTAARNSNIYVSSSTSTTDEQAIDWWMQAPFHSMGLMDPRLTSTGFGSYRQVKSGWDMGAAVDVLRGNSFTGGHYPVYFPGDGGSEPLTTYGGYEYPDPLQACSGYSAPTGLPVYIEVGGNVATTAGPVHSFTGNGVALAHCVIDSHNASVGSMLSTRGGVILIPRQPLVAGVKYVVALTVNGAPYTWSFSVGPISGCSAAGISANPPSPQKPGTIVSITGSATCQGTPTYRFWVGQSGAWSIAQDYSLSSTFAWNTTGKAPGAYGLEVDVRDQGSTVVYEKVANMTYSLGTANAAPCSTASLAASPTSSPTGGSVLLTASASGCPTPTYRFWVGQNGAWTIVRDYSTANTFTWTGTGWAGSYGVEVDVRNAGSTASYERVANITYSVVACSAAHLGAGVPSPQAAGATVVLTGSSTCPGTPEYRFWVGKNGAWTIVQDFSATSTFTWNTAGKLAGAYGLEVDVRDHGATAGYEAVANLTFVLVTAPCTSAHLAPSKPSPQVHGTTVVLTGAATCSGTPQYRFWVRDLSGRWTIVQDYSGANTFSWNTTGLAPGIYGLEVDVRNAGSTAVYETVANLNFQVT
jgi:hypothetical protein